MTVILMALGSPAVLAAEIEGRVLFDGPPPAPEKMTIKSKSKQYPIEGCGSPEKVSPKLRVAGDGGVRDVVVWLDVSAENGGKGTEGAVPILMDQKECVFTPHVVVTPAGGSVAIRNSDKMIHNVRIFPEGVPSMLMHQWQKPDAADIVWQFKEPGRYVVRCGVHPWMYGWVFAAPSRSVAVTDEAGRFAVAGVPDGRHTLHLWHETLGSREVPVSVDSQRVELAPIRLSGMGKNESDH